MTPFLELLLNFLVTFISLVVLTDVVILIVRFLVGLWIRVAGGYGKLVTCFDGTFDNYLSSGNSKFHMVFTLELDGDLSVEELRNIFWESVLNATIKLGKKMKPRYPEFQQYIGSILGFPVWKDEENFDITEHIVEHIPEKKFVDLGELHEVLLNRSLPLNRSPWEMVLIRNIIPADRTDPEFFEKRDAKTILALKTHHVMGDFKSMQKVLVECMGKKKLNVQEAREEEMGLVKRLSLPLLFPLYFLQRVWTLLHISWSYRSHPLTVRWDDNSNIRIKFSTPQRISSLKAFAHQNGVTLSAVLISIIAGAVRDYCKIFGRKGLKNNGEAGLAYILPIANHPSVLINHCGMGFSILPTKFDSPSDRLHHSQSIFKTMKQLEQYVPSPVFIRQLGCLPRSRLKQLLHRVYFNMIGITNVAGDKDGFSVGEAPCSDFRFCVGVPPGFTGAAFAILSYRDHLRFTLMGRESVMSDQQAEQLVDLINSQCERITNSTVEQ